MSTLVMTLVHLVSTAAETPSEDEIGAGWWYLIVFVLLAAAVAFLGFSLTKQLRKTRANAESGVFGDDDKA